MKLAELNPQWGMTYRDHEKTPDRGGIPTGIYWLSFICPTCRNGGVVVIHLNGEPPSEAARRWKAEPAPGGSPAWMERVTITPSIDNTGVVDAHGRKRPPCRFHGSITNGEVVLS